MRMFTSDSLVIKPHWHVSFYNNIIIDIYIHICHDTAKHQSKPQEYIYDIALRSDIAPAVETDYKKTTLTFSKVPTKR